MGYFDSINKKKISVEDTREKLKIREDNLRKDVMQSLKKEFVNLRISPEFRNNIIWFSNCITEQMAYPQTDPYKHEYCLLKENPFGGNTDVLFDFDPNLYNNFPHDIKLGKYGIMGLCNLGKFFIHREKFSISIEPQLTNSGWEIKVIIPWTMELCGDIDDTSEKISEYIKQKNQRLLNDYHYPISIKDFLIKILHTEPYNYTEINKVDFVTVQKEIIKMIEKTMSRQPALEHMGIQIPVKCEMPINLSFECESQLKYLINRYRDYPNNFTGPVTSQLMTIQ